MVIIWKLRLQAQKFASAISTLESKFEWSSINSLKATFQYTNFALVYSNPIFSFLHFKCEYLKRSQRVFITRISVILNLINYTTSLSQVLHST